MVTATTDSLPRVLRQSAQAWRPRRRVSRADWCEAELRLPPETSADNTRFDLSAFPWIRGMLEALDDPETREIAIMGSTQVGKTTFLHGAMASTAALSPAPQMLAAPDRDFAREQRDKVYRLCEESPALRDGIPPARQRNDRWIDFGPSLAYLAWSGNTQRLSGKACKFIWCTEVDRWRITPREGRTAQIISERAKAFFRYLIVREGTPTDQNSTIAALYHDSDRRRFLVPCPKCGHWQELRFFVHKTGPFAGCGGLAGMTDKSGAVLSPDEALTGAYYKCEQGCTIRNEQKPDMIPFGRWVPLGQSIDKKGKLRGTPKRGPRSVGFHISALYSLIRTWGEVAAKWLATRDDVESLRVFWNNWLGLPFSVQSRVPKWRELGRRLAGNHSRGVVPAGAFFLTAGADVQEDCVYWIVRAWGEGATSWLVDFGRYNRQIGPEGRFLGESDLVQLNQMMGASYRLAEPNAVGVNAMRVRLLNIDVNYRSLEVHGWAKTQSAARVRCVAGEPGILDLFRATRVDKSARDGKPYPGGLIRWGLKVDAFKEDLQSRWTFEPGRAGGWWLFRQPTEVAETYLRQITNEGPIMARDPRGRKVQTWQVIDQKTGNHYWDCEVYARAAAEMVTGGDWHDLASKAAPAAKHRTTKHEPEIEPPR